MIIVIGGSSFIGVYTIENLLNHGCEVIATGRNPKFKKHYEALGVEYINLDISNCSDFDHLPTDNVEGVILLAGLLPANSNIDICKSDNASEYFKINTIGTINVLDYCKRNGIKRLISTTSYADVFDSWRSDIPIKENEPRGFSFKGDHCAYVISKNAATDIMEYYNQQHGMFNAVFRLPPVYGVGPHSSFYVNGTYTKSGLQIFIEQALKGEPITVFGDRGLSRDVIYVKDVAEAFYKALFNSNTYGLYNMTSGNAITLDEQAKIIAEVFSQNGVVSEVRYDVSKRNNTTSYLFDMTKALKDFGFTPKYKNFKNMMLDYKHELEINRFAELFK